MGPLPRDVNQTEQQSAELEHGRLTSLINSMADGVMAIDENQNVVMTNGAALNILDVNTTVVNRPLHQVLPVLDKNNQPINIKALIHKLKSSFSTRDWKLIYPDKSQIKLYVSIAPVRLGFGKKGMSGFVIILRDITREKSLEEERDEFISVVSHELRTPISIAEGNIGNAGFIFKKSGLQHKAVEEALEEAHNQILFLAGLINDLATLSRAERGKLTLELEPINVHKFLEDLAKTYAGQADDKNLQIKLDIDPHLELLKSSTLYVKEIMQNFITNALKYTERGYITVGARAKSGGVEFYVEDTGIGISKADQEKVFDKFFRSGDFRTRASNGTGLGLYVTMKLARLLHAEIEFESEIDHGSTFRIYIPNLE